MPPAFHPRRVVPVAVLVALAAGCHSTGRVPEARVVPADIPRELDKVILPEYRVEPPDILIVEAVRAVPKPPYLVQPLDVINVQVTQAGGGAGQDDLTGALTVDPDGTVNLGPEYGGAVRVAGMTIPEIQAAITKQLKEVALLKNPKVTVSLGQTQSAQRISGPHLVSPDGTITLGTYGRVRVAGLTLAEAKRAVEAQLSERLLDPVVSVDVQNYNSKLLYVVMDGGGAGQSVYRLPVTGNDTVLDAIAQVNGLTAISDVNRIWVSRPAPAGAGHQILPVDWREITECGGSATNYQLMPGDRIFVGAVPASALDIRMARLLAPVERFFGITLLGAQTYRSVAAPLNFGGGGFGGGGFGGGF